MTRPVDPTVIDPIPIRILIVADGRIRFDSEDYSLSLMIEALHQQASPIVRFSITTAYRVSKNPTSDDSNGAGADRPAFTFENGRFRDHYDEIWFFGDQQEVIRNGAPSPQTTQLSSQELATVRGFMDDGGGVFATGDHESRGASIGAHLPRVRGMRTWHNGPTAGDGSTRNNTVVPQHIEESSIPQHIITAIYQADGFPPYPHPLLDSPRGMIEVLPDHVHEGTCDPMPQDSIARDTSDSGVAVVPIGIAQSTRNPPPDVPAPPRFAAMKAYDGHLAGVGRIAVDASFHHFVSQNLRPFASTLTPGNAGGELRVFKTGADALADIKGYYQNIALWLAPPKRQTKVFIRALWEVRWRSRVFALLLTPAGVTHDGQVSPKPDRARVLQVGTETRAALSLMTSRSCTLLWALETFNRFPGAAVLLRNMYPWLPQNGPPQKRSRALMPNSGADESGVTVMIGAVMIAMATRFPATREFTIKDLNEDMNEVIAKGVQIAEEILNRH